MKKRNRIVSLLLTGVVVSAMFAGCGEKQTDVQESSQTSTESSVQSTEPASTESSQTEEEPTSKRISEETITLTVAGLASNSDNDWNATEQFKQYEEQLGIKLDATTYTSEQWPSKKTLMLASDEMPDIFANAQLTADEIAEYGEDGYFLDFSEYLDIMPNLSAYMDKYPEYAAALKDDEGHIYGLSQINESPAMYLFHSTFINQKWLNNLGLENPKSLDDLYDVLVAFRDEDADGNGDPDDEIPMGYQGSSWYHTEYIILWAHGIYGATNDGMYHRMVDENNQVVLGNVTDNYKDFLKYMNKLYSEKLINEDCYVVNKDELLAAMTEQKLGVMMNTRLLPPVDDDIERTKTWTILGGLSDETYSPDGKIVLYGRTSLTRSWAVNAETEYPEEICKFFDYLYTDEGAASSLGNFVGITCDEVDFFGATIHDTKPYLDQFGGEENFQANTCAINAFMPVSTQKFGAMGAMESLSMEDLLSDECRVIGGQNMLKEVVMREYEGNVMNGYPLTQFTAEEAEERATLHTDILNYIKTMKAQFITGELDIDANWDTYLAELDMMGLDRLMEIEQAALDRYLAK